MTLSIISTLSVGAAGAFALYMLFATRLICNWKAVAHLPRLQRARVMPFQMRLLAFLGVGSMMFSAHGLYLIQTGLR